MSFLSLLLANLPLAVVLLLLTAVPRWPAMLRHLLVGAGFLGALATLAASAIAPATAHIMVTTTTGVSEPDLQSGLPLPVTPADEQPLTAVTPRANAVRIEAIPCRALWILGASIVLVAALIERALLWRLAEREAPATAQLEALARRATSRLGMSPQYRIRILANHHLLRTGPCTFGSWRPMVLLPERALDWPTPELEAVLRHESAHIVRFDDAWRLLATICCALLWWSPLAWMAAYRLTQESELAADAAALNGGVEPADYAQRVLSEVGGTGSVFRTSLGLSTGSRRSLAVRHRLTHILDGNNSTPYQMERVNMWSALPLVLFAAAPLGLVRLDAVAPAFSQDCESLAPLSRSTMLTCTTHDLPVSHLTRLRIDARSGGAILVRPSTDGRLTLRAVALAAAGSRASLTTMAGDTVRADADAARGEWVWYELLVPPGTPLDLETSTGPLTIAPQVDAAVRAHTTYGPLTVHTGRGTVTGGSEYGPVALDVAADAGAGTGLDLHARYGPVSRMVPADFVGQLIQGGVLGGSTGNGDRDRAARERGRP